ncbi:MAG: DUF1273 family protein [Clostridia bacterium]|nr:DUF1273 family protein [Clostridia bacterium]
MINNVCCFIGHREINATEALKDTLYALVENLIVNNGVDTFLFGSKSSFNGLCHRIVTRLKEKYPHIKRVYVRAEYSIIDDGYKGYILKNYEETFYPEKIGGAGKAVYLRRNREMIDRSKYCVFYYDEKKEYANRKSGTKAALRHARKKKRNIINAYLPLS